MMTESYYEVYRLRAGPDTDHLRYRSYRQLQDSNLKVSIDNYSGIYKADLQESMLARAIRKKLEDDPPPALREQPIGISDVIAITDEGITSAYYLDPNMLILIPDFFHQPASGALITIDADNLPLDGRKGSWMTIDTLRLDDRNLFLMQSKDYGRDAPYVIVDEQGRELAADKKGFTEESIEQIRKSLKEMASRQIVELEQAPDKKPKLEIWQQYFENGEYLRSAEISEEQNYNMIDGRANNRAPRRSVLERLQEKQSEVKQGTPPAHIQELAQESEIERNRK